jgi:trans-aconitate methyltransferase
MTVDRVDHWGGAAAYEAYVGRWSGAVAARFLDWLQVQADQAWVDLGCGTGVLTAAILGRCEPRSVTGVDPSEPFLAHARETIRDPRAEFRAGTAADTGLLDSQADVVVGGLVLNFVPDVAAALTEARRVVVRGGVVAGYVWDYAEGMQFIRAFWDAAIPFDPAARELDEASRFPIAAPEALSGAFTAAGFESVSVRGIEIPTVFADFDDLWLPFLGGTGSAPTYLASLEPASREAVRERLRTSVPIELDGSIRLSARAWAFRGDAPGEDAAH